MVATATSTTAVVVAAALVNKWIRNGMHYYIITMQFLIGLSLNVLLLLACQLLLVQHLPFMKIRLLW
jgi:hypothetical protein